jgi:hypothetical protein
MGRPRKFKPGEGAVLTFRIETELLERLNNEVAAEIARAGKLTSRSNVLKDLLREALNVRARKKRGK